MTLWQCPTHLLTPTKQSCMKPCQNDVMCFYDSVIVVVVKTFMVTCLQIHQWLNLTFSNYTCIYGNGNPISALSGCIIYGNESVPGTRCLCLWKLKQGSTLWWFHAMLIISSDRLCSHTWVHCYMNTTVTYVLDLPPHALAIPRPSNDFLEKGWVIHMQWGNSTLQAQPLHHPSFHVIFGMHTVPQLYMLHCIWLWLTGICCWTKAYLHPPYTHTYLNMQCS